MFYYFFISSCQFSPPVSSYLFPHGKPQKTVGVPTVVETPPCLEGLVARWCHKHRWLCGPTAWTMASWWTLDSNKPSPCPWSEATGEPGRWVMMDAEWKLYAMENWMEKRMDVDGCGMNVWMYAISVFWLRNVANVVRPWGEVIASCSTTCNIGSADLTQVAWPKHHSVVVSTSCFACFEKGHFTESWHSWSVPRIAVHRSNDEPLSTDVYTLYIYIHIYIYISLHHTIIYTSWRSQSPPRVNLKHFRKCTERCFWIGISTCPAALWAGHGVVDASKGPIFG